MLKRFIPKDENFYGFFSDISELARRAASALQKAISDPSKIDEVAAIVSKLEAQADDLSHETLEKLRETFITPFDREQIHALISQLDDVVDLLHAATERMKFYRIQIIPAESKTLALKCEEAVDFMGKAVSQLKTMKENRKIKEFCVEVHRVENEADHLFRVAQGKLLNDEPDLRTMMKLKELNEVLESVTDRCEDVAGILEGIVLENA
ncbi:MAG: DUF47 domain-containing protein [Bacteriovoracia bacterium]